MRGSNTVGSATPTWLTLAEAAFLSDVPVERVRGWVEEGAVRHRSLRGGAVLVDATTLPGADGPGDEHPPDQPPPSGPAGADEGAPASDIAARLRTAGLICLAIGALVALAAFVVRFHPLGAGVHPLDVGGTKAMGASAPSSPALPPVGRDPFASPFSGHGTGGRDDGVLVKPPAAVAEGTQVTAAATVVNHNRQRWLPPSEVTFLARDDTGQIIARSTQTVSLGPGGVQTVIAPNLGGGAGDVAAIEARIDPAPLRGRSSYREPAVRVVRADVTEGDGAIRGVVVVGRDAPGRVHLACAVFDASDTLISVATSTLAPEPSAHEVRFRVTVRLVGQAPYRASCEVI